MVMGVTNWKRLYTDASIMLDKYQNEVVPKLREQLEKRVEVVRCKDCQHRGDDVHCPMCFEEEIEWDDDGYTEVDWILHDRTTDDGFCDRGERRE
jgi:hypothetical protein